MPGTIFDAKPISNRSRFLILRSSLIVILALSLGGCLIWPLKVAEELDVEVIDGTSGTPSTVRDSLYLE